MPVPSGHETCRAGSQRARLPLSLSHYMTSSGRGEREGGKEEVGWKCGLLKLLSLFLVARFQHHSNSFRSHSSHIFQPAADTCNSKLNRKYKLLVHLHSMSRKKRKERHKLEHVLGHFVQLILESFKSFHLKVTTPKLIIS